MHDNEKQIFKPKWNLFKTNIREKIMNQRSVRAPKDLALICPWKGNNSPRKTYTIKKGDKVLISKCGRGICNGINYIYDECIVTQLNCYSLEVLEYICDFISTGKMPPTNSKWHCILNNLGQRMLDVYQHQMRLKR